MVEGQPGVALLVSVYLVNKRRQSRAYLIYDDVVIVIKEYLDSKYTPSPETANYVAGYLLSPLDNVLGNVSRREKDLVRLNM